MDNNTQTAETIRPASIQWEDAPYFKETVVGPLAFKHRDKAFLSGRAAIGGIKTDPEEMVIIRTDVDRETKLPQPSELYDRWISEAAINAPGKEYETIVAGHGFSLSRKTIFARMGYLKPVAKPASLRTGSKARAKDGSPVEGESAPRPVAEWAGAGITWRAWVVRSFSYANLDEPEQTYYLIEAGDHGELLIPKAWVKGLKDFVEYTKARTAATLEDFNNLRMVLTDTVTPLKKMRDQAAVQGYTNKPLERTELLVELSNKLTRDGAEYTRQALLASAIAWLWRDPMNDPRLRLLNGDLEDLGRGAWKNVETMFKMLVN